jgi:hypothetical protein
MRVQFRRYLLVEMASLEFSKMPAKRSIEFNNSAVGHYNKEKHVYRQGSYLLKVKHPGTIHHFSCRACEHSENKVKIKL